MEDDGQQRYRGIVARFFIGSLALALVAGVGLLSFGQDTEREFSFPPDPGHELLKARFVGGTMGIESAYTVFADGHLVIERKSHANEVVFEALEVDLSYEETTTLIKSAVDAGLMEYEVDDIKRRMGSASSAYFSTDGATMILTINLPSYKMPGKAQAEPKSVEISFYSPGTAAPHYPMVPEIKGLADLAKSLRSYKKNAEKVKR